MKELVQIMKECGAKEHKLASLIAQLRGNEHDMAALETWRELLLKENTCTENTRNVQALEKASNPAEAAEALQGLIDLEEQRIIWLERIKKTMLEKMFA